MLGGSDRIGIAEISVSPDDAQITSGISYPGIASDLRLGPGLLEAWLTAE